MSRLAGVRRVAEVVALVILAAAPFLAYAGVRVWGQRSERAWPADVVLAARHGENLTGFVLVHFRGSPSEPVGVAWPAETVLEAPGGGDLRAATTFRIGGPSLLAQALEQTLGLDVPYWASGPGGAGGIPDTISEHNLRRHLSRLEALMSRYRAGKLAVMGARGSYRKSADGREFGADLVVIHRMLLGGLVEIEATPAARPSGASPGASPQR